MFPSTVLMESGAMEQWIYRQERKELFVMPELRGAEFELLVGPLDALKVWRPLVRCLGILELVKTVLKLATGRRRFYCIYAEGRVVHRGWVSFSFCRYYQVKSRDVVIGPIHTDETAQGHGYATQAMKRMMNALLAEGYRTYWIDTSEDNIPCQKVIAKCGFGAPVTTFDRPVDGL